MRGSFARKVGPSALRVLVDAGPVDPRFRALLEAHPSSLDPRQAREPLTERMRWDNRGVRAAHAAGEPLNAFAGSPPYFARPHDHWLLFTVSDREAVAFATTEVALDRLKEQADAIERAMTLYARWAKEDRAAKAGRRSVTG